MSPLLQAVLFFAALGAWPAWRVWQRQRRAHGTHEAHLPGHRRQPPMRGHGEAEVAQGIFEIREMGG